MGVEVSRLRGLVRELQRRKVFRVAVAYGAAAFAILQVADIAFPALHFPAWTVTFIVIAAILGFPLAVALSWAYELTPDRGPPQDPYATPETPGAAAVRETAVAAYGAVADPSPPRPARSLGELPSQPTPFVGRRDELAQLRRLLLDPDYRLVTVTGPGGIGKTRLALQAAAENAHAFAEGVCFVPLGGLATVESLLPTIAACLGLTLSGREDPRQQLFDFLRGKQLLLVLDNFEHLAGGAALLAEILEHAPKVELLTTSRERLQLHGETLFPLQGLSVPADAAEAAYASSDAVRLFLLGARRVQPDFEPAAGERVDVVRICRLLEGIPLALELASAWVRMLSCAEIVREIERDHDFLAGATRDVPERHRSLRAVFESAWRLLREDERRVFRRLSVFRGGFRREAAERVADATVPLLSALVDKSLLRRASTGRFEILEVLRQHAEDRLAGDAAERERVERRHGEYYAELLHELRDRLESAEEKRALERVDEEIENTRAAWRWAVREPRIDCLDAALDTLFTFYDARGWAREGEETFGAAAAALRRRRQEPRPPQAEAMLGRLLVRQGVFSADLGLVLRAREQLKKGLARLRRLDERREVAFALDQLGNLLYSAGEYTDARRHYSESLALYRELPDRRGTGRLLTHLGNVAYALGDYPTAQLLHRESLALLEETGDRRRMSTCLRHLGIVAGVSGDTEAARRFFERGLAIDREIGNPRGLALSYQNLGSLCWMAGEHEQADEHLRQAVAICEDIGSRRLLAFCLNVQGNVARALDKPRESRALYAQALATAREIGETPLMLEILIGVARLRADAGEEAEAIELLAHVLDHPACDQGARDAAQTLIGELGERVARPAFRAAAERGKVADLDGLVRQVLEEAAVVGVPERA